MEKIPNSCTLFSFVMESPTLANTELLRHIFRELVRINVMLQNYRIWHRDCKPENILYVKDDCSLRLIDFGSAAPVQSEDFREFQVCLRFIIFFTLFFRVHWKLWHRNGYYKSVIMVKRRVYGH
jgi:serine/threonine protein kinase